MDNEEVNKSELSGEELFKRFLEGEKHLFEDIVSLYKDDLYTFLYNIVHDYHETKHLVIESFARLALNGKKYSGKSSLKTYLFTIGNNIARRYLKSRRKHNHILYDEAIDILLEHNETPEKLIENEENKKILREAMNELKEDYRTVLELIYFQDISIKETASIMDKSVRQINDLSYRAKAALKKKLESMNFTYH